MRRDHRIRHEFVEAIPPTLRDGVLYVSIPFVTVVHRCFCGCGKEVVTPLGPTDWRLTFDGETVSLWPSVGSWNLPCRSHYWIEESVVHWARGWSAAEVDAARVEERREKRWFFRRRSSHRDSPPPESTG